MSENHQSQRVQNGIVVPEDEIELIDILRVIWKWKYLIIGGTFIFVLAAVIICFYLQPIYQISMMLKPGISKEDMLKSGIFKEDVTGIPVYLDTAESSKSIIESELIFKVLEHSKNKRGVSSSGAYKISANKKENTLSILCESTDRKEGIESLNYLSNLLRERYENKLKYLQDNIEHEILITKRQLELHTDEEKFITAKLDDIQKKLVDFIQELGTGNDSSEYRGKSRKNLLDYASIVEIISDLKRRYSEINSQIDVFKKEIADLEKGKFSKQVIVVVQPPTASQHPIKPNKKNIITLAAVVGLFIMLFLTLFIEYITKNRKKRSIEL